MRQLRGKFILVLCAAILMMPLFAQQNLSNQRKELEQKRKELSQKIQQTKKVLEETKNKQNKSLADLRVISQQIQNREKVISNVAEQIMIIEGQINGQHVTINNLRDDIARLKQDYGRSIAAAYKQRNVYDKILFIFSAETFNQAAKRIQYLNQMGDFRKHQAELILRTQKEIIAQLNELIATKREKLGLMSVKEEEKKELEVDKKEESQVLAKLQEREKDLRRQLADNEKAARKLNQAIADLIQKEIAEAKRKEEEARKREAAKANAGKTKTPEAAKNNKGTESKGMFLTPEAQKLSNDFESNRNNLPWPVEKGYIAERFGTHAHATLKGVMVNNNGIDITTQPNVTVRSVFKGTVKKVFNIPGMGKVVLISHGKYYTAYAKLESVNVKEGQSVDTKQPIGVVMTDEDEGVTEVHFEIWNMDKKQDPEAWLKN